MFVNYEGPEAFGNSYQPALGSFLHTLVQRVICEYRTTDLCPKLRGIVTDVLSNIKRLFIL